MKVNFSQYISRVAAFIVIAIACFVIVGWSNDIQSLKQVFPGLPTMKFNTALCFIFCGISLLCCVVRPSKIQKKLAFISSTIALLISSLSLLEHVLKSDFYIDELFWTDKDPASVLPGRMGLITASLFILTSISLLVLPKRKYHWITQVSLPVILLFSLFVAFSYISGLNYLEIFPVVITTALHTSMCFAILAVGIFYSPCLGYLSFSFGKRIAGYFAAALLILGIVFFSFDRNNNRFFDDSALVDHTKEVLFTSLKVLNQAQDIETGARGYIITGDTGFLEPFEKGSEQIIRTVATLKNLTANNSKQLQRVHLLEKLIDSNISVRQNAINLRKNNQPAAANAIIASGIEKEMMDSLRNMITDIQDSENISLINRKAESEKGIDRSLRLITIMQILLALFLLMVFYIVYKNAVIRDKAEKALRKSEGLTRGLIDNTNNAIAIRDLSGRFMLANKEIQRNMKLSEEELIGKNIYDLLPDQTREMLRAQEQQVIDTGQMIEADSEAILPDGHRYYVSVRFPLYNEKNKIYAICSVSTDVTNLKKTQEELARSNRHQQLILNGIQQLMNASTDVICVIDRDGKFVQTSGGSVNLWGYTPGEMIGRSYIDMVYEEDRAISLNAASTTMHGQDVHDFENRYIRKDGRLVPVIWTATWSAEDQMMYTIARNGTERKLTAEQLQDLNISLAKRAAELLSSNTELERFAYVASHDLQEPLRMVTSFLQLLEKKLEAQLDETTRKYIDFAIDGAERMKVLIQDLLQYSRVGTNKETISAVDCNEIINAVVRMFSLAIQESGAKMDITPLPVIQGEKGLIQQLFHNLIGNALKYAGKEAPVIEVGYEDKKDAWQFYVKDNGIGIDERFFDKIFIIFQRLHNKTEYSGTGIGLAICKKIVERHGGKIWVESKPKMGSTFYVLIPKQINRS